MKIENRTELKEYRIECQKKQSADCRVLVCGVPRSYLKRSGMWIRQDL